MYRYIPIQQLKHLYFIVSKAHSLLVTIVYINQLKQRYCFLKVYKILINHHTKMTTSDTLSFLFDFTKYVIKRTLNLLNLSKLNAYYTIQVFNVILFKYTHSHIAFSVLGKMITLHIQYYKHEIFMLFCYFFLYKYTYLSGSICIVNVLLCLNLSVDTKM